MQHIQSLLTTSDRGDQRAYGAIGGRTDSSLEKRNDEDGTPGEQPTERRKKDIVTPSGDNAVLSPVTLRKEASERRGYRGERSRAETDRGYVCTRGIKAEGPCVRVAPNKRGRRRFSVSVDLQKRFQPALSRPGFDRRRRRLGWRSSANRVSLLTDFI
ncbi:hypothetical protein SKAU_G00303190 [Synaphobranchus kaupii]|uniref:Uncharacterized protein n=1 Tax=Synaphobranchus kaupii TaxID=118154 RepID=A0A9Q1EW68_SYNKA|nr:hypothetical protein SKAU_G00303190 [Synaphobranchus kaupii]